MTTEGTSTSSAPLPSNSNATRLQKFLGMYLFGLVGIVGLGVTLSYQFIVDPPTTSLPLYVVIPLSLLEPSILLLVAVGIGLRYAPRLGLQSHVHNWLVNRTPVFGALRPDVRVAVEAGLVGGILIVGLDALFVAMGVPTLSGTNPSTAVGWLATLPMRLLYGGITEELLLRWGVLSLIAWLLWRFVSRADQPPVWAFWFAIVGAALLFGLAHIPALAAIGPLTGLLVVRTVLLNALLGGVFGWLFWRRSLEAAMIAHASFHVVIVSIGLITALL